MTTSAESPAALRPLRAGDYGFFGPDSITWRVWTAPTVLIGFQRLTILDFFDPFVNAALSDMQGMYRAPRHRVDNTLTYLLTLALADGRTAAEAADRLMGVHAKAVGIEPISGKRYNGNNPRSQLYAHVTGWHSALKSYEQYGPGPLTPEEDQRFWQECAVAGQLHTFKPNDVPRSRTDVRAYFMSIRPQLCVSERAYQNIQHLLHTPYAQAGTLFWAGSRLIGPATIATLPRWMRAIGGFEQPALVDRAVSLATRATLRALGSSSAATCTAISVVAPTAGALMRAHVRCAAPTLAQTVTPAQALAQFNDHTDELRAAAETEMSN